MLQSIIGLGVGTCGTRRKCERSVTATYLLLHAGSDGGRGGWHGGGCLGRALGVISMGHEGSHATGSACMILETRVARSNTTSQAERRLPQSVPAAWANQGAHPSKRGPARRPGPQGVHPSKRANCHLILSKFCPIAPSHS